MPMTKEKRKEWRETNKDKLKEYYKEYYEKNKDKNKDKLKKQQKEYREANKDKEIERHKKYRESNEEKIKEYAKEYGKTETGKKNIIINKWITRFKIKFADRNEAEFYYNSYINTHRCTWCDKMFKDSKERQFDHCHTCSLPRAIICRECNIKDLVPCVNCLL